jgi:hypothetical protein
MSPVPDRGHHALGEVASMLERQRALIVTEDSSNMNRWAMWLEEEGFSVSSCSGPHTVGRCPRLDGIRCSLREAAEIAVVDVHPLGETEVYGGWAERSCTRIPDDGRTVFVHEPRINGTFSDGGIHIGARVSRDALVSAVRRLRRLVVARPPPA